MINLALGLGAAAMRALTSSLSRYSGRIPQIMTLKSSRRLQVSNNDSGVTVIGYSDREQRRWWVRAIYYVLVGWWATFVWLLLLWIAGILIITLPISFWMAGQTGKVQTLRR